RCLPVRLPQLDAVAGDRSEALAGLSGVHGAGRQAARGPGRARRGRPGGARRGSEPVRPAPGGRGGGAAMNGGDSQDAVTAEVMARFNAVFQEHDPAALAELVAEDCIIENTGPAPDGARHVGRAACIELWRSIATTPGTGFDHERTIV